MSKADSSNLRGAIAAQLFEESDVLISKVDLMLARADAINARLVATAATLNDSSASFQRAVTVFVAQAKNDIDVHVQNAADIGETRSTADFSAAIQKTAQQAFDLEALRAAEDMRGRLAAATHHFKVDRWDRLKEYGLVAAGTALVTAVICKALVVF